MTDTLNKLSVAMVEFEKADLKAQIHHRTKIIAIRDAESEVEGGEWKNSSDAFPDVETYLGRPLTESEKKIVRRSYVFEKGQAAARIRFDQDEAERDD